MKRYRVLKVGQELQVEGLPNSAKLVRLTGGKAKRLADLALHRNDLVFSQECLEAIDAVSSDPRILREALWRSAIIHYVKCFGSGESRSSLSFGKIFKDDSAAKEIHKYFVALRNKHLVHDDNSYTWASPGAAVRPPSAATKVAEVFCITAVGVTLNQTNYGNLHRLGGVAKSFVETQFESLCAQLSDELESASYQDLTRMETIVYAAPDVGDAYVSRTAS